MRTPTRRWGPWLQAVVTLLVAGACERPDTNWEPARKETSVHSVGVEVERAASAVEAALSTVATDPHETAEQLRAADRVLRHLLDFYLPLVEAREYSYNALLFFTHGEVERAEDELDGVESRLEAIAESDHGKLLHEMEPPLELLEDSRTAIHADPVEASELLGRLATRLNNMVLKGGLIVD